MFADPIGAVLAYAALQAGHHAGDYWLQTDAQAMTKGTHSHAGRLACTGHVATLTAAQGLALAAVTAATGTPLDPAAAVLGLSVNAASHWWADRRSTLRGLVLVTEPLVRKRAFYDSVGAGPMDQAFHAFWLLPAALIAAAPLVWALAATGACVLVLLGCHLAAEAGHRREAREICGCVDGWLPSGPLDGLGRPLDGYEPCNCPRSAANEGVDQ